MSNPITLMKSVLGNNYSDDLLRYALEKKGNNIDAAVEAIFTLEFTEKSLPSKPSMMNFSSLDSGNSRYNFKSKNGMKERFIATFILSGACDAIGFYNGKFEFNKNGEDINRKVFEMGGVENIDVSRGWKVSDDTVMHKATGRALIEHSSDNLEDLYQLLCKYYILSGKDMEGRAPGDATMSSLMLLEGIVPYEGRKITPKKWNEIPFMPKGGGCGGAMRAMCIGLKYFGEKNREILTAISIESARMTHNHPCAFLGAFNSALFTAFAIEGKPVESWPYELLKELPRAEAYVKKTQRDYDLYKSQGNYSYFETQWQSYISFRIPSSKITPFSSIKERDNFYKKISFDGWGGSSGHDINIIAFDSLISCKNSNENSWELLVKNGCLHYGDCDSTGALAGAWYGACYGFQNVYEKNVKKLEYEKELKELGEMLFVMSGLED